MLIEVRYVTTGLIGPMSTNFLNLETEFCEILYQKMLFKAAMNIYNFVMYAYMHYVLHTIFDNINIIWSNVWWRIIMPNILSALKSNFIYHLIETNWYTVRYRLIFLRYWKTV